MTSAVPEARRAPVRFLMCPPTWFGTDFVLNPFMRWDETVDRDLALSQWDGLGAALRVAGAELAVVDPLPGAPAMTFTRDVAIVCGRGEAILLANDGPRGEIEPLLARRWLRREGYRVQRLPSGRRIDGGNILRLHDGRWLIGVKPGADLEAERWVARVLHERTGTSVTAVPLVSGAYLHLDMVLADLGGRAWLLHPGGIPGRGSADEWRGVLGDRPVIEVTTEEAAALAVNVVVVGDAVVGDVPPRVAVAIDGLGLAVVPVELGELRKAGGAAHCLTLELIG